MASLPDRLLVVDDEEANRDMLSRRLQRAGFDVETAPGGSEALRLIEEKRFELVLLDHMMPGMTGIELLKLLRAVHSPTDLPVIMVTAISDGERVAEALELGANDYVTKPIDFQIALARIQAQLKRSKAELVLRESEERLALATSDGIWDYDLRIGKIHYSSRWKEMLDYSETEIGDGRDEWLSRVHEADRPELEVQLELLANRAASKEFAAEYRMLHRDGVYRWMLNRGVIVRSSQGEALRVVGSQRDITNRKMFDPLTRLPSLASLLESLHRHIRDCAAGKTRPFCVLFIGIDRLKDINESLGHSAGDWLLIETGRRLARSVRNGSLRRPVASDYVARFGGDEFAMVLGDISSAREAMDIAARIEAIVASPFTPDEHAPDKRNLHATVSIGATTSNGEYRLPVDMLRDAQTAMHRARRPGRARTALFEPTMRTQAVQRFELERDLQFALDRREFLVYYQPMVALASGEVAGFEALVRWQHPTRGLVAPSEFIPVAENIGIIGPIGEFVLRQSCEMAKRWHERFPDRLPLGISVNLSPCQFRDGELIHKIRTILRETGLDPARLHLEVTESVLIDDWASTIDVLRQLREMQVGVKIDDFGTGHSSLSYLSQLPCDSLKIDQSFVRMMLSDPSSLEIVRSVIGLAVNLGLSVVAEGIDSREQIDCLKELGCGIGQGYYFAEPLTPEQAWSLIERVVAPRYTRTGVDVDAARSRNDNGCNR